MTTTFSAQLRHPADAGWRTIRVRTTRFDATLALVTLMRFSRMDRDVIDAARDVFHGATVVALSGTKFRVVAGGHRRDALCPVATSKNLEVNRSNLLHPHAVV